MDPASFTSPEARFLAEIPDSVFVLDVEGHVRFVNNRVVTGTGIDRSEFIGVHYSELFDFVLEPDAVDEFSHLIERLLAGKRSDEHRIELPIYAPEFGDITTELRFQRVENEGEIEGLVCVMRDITERKRNERQLQQLSDELTMLNRLLRHDLCNDLNVIQGWVEELRSRTDPAERDVIIERVLRTTEQSVELTEGARELITVLESERDPVTRLIDVVSILAQEVQKARHRYPKATFEFQGESSEILIRASPLSRSLFANLLNNAVVHNGRETPTICVSVDSDDEHVIVAIADDGPGVSDAEKDRIFRQGVSGGRNAGTGIGLYLVHRLTEQYGGMISVSDNEPRGVVFEVTFPITDAGM